MTLPNTGSLSFTQIRDEFGPAPSLGAYRVSFSNTAQGGTLSNVPLDDGIPSGNNPISYSQFRGKSVNIVIDYYTGGTETRSIARNDYNAGRRFAIGGFKSLNENTSGSKIIIDIGKEIRSSQFRRTSNGNTYCAFRTGTFTDGTVSLNIRVGPNGYIQGHGGSGGQGSNNGSSSAEDGFQGGSAIGIQDGSPVTIDPIQGFIGGGSGGGGGGSGRRGNGRTAGGGGGGGGAGNPAGEGGEGGDPPNGGSAADNGEDGNLTTGGQGGDGGDLSGQDGGDGGNGGDRNNSGQGGDDGGDGSGGEGGDGDGGQGGQAIRQFGQTIR